MKTLKFIFTKEFMTRYFKGWGIIIVSPFAWLVLGPYMRARQFEENERAVKETLAQLEKLQAESARTRGH